MEIDDRDPGEMNMKTGIYARTAEERKLAKSKFRRRRKSRYMGSKVNFKTVTPGQDVSPQTIEIVDRNKLVKGRSKMTCLIVQAIQGRCFVDTTEIVDSQRRAGRLWS